MGEFNPGDGELAADVATTVVCALAAELPPDVLSVVHVATAAGASMDALDQLPHLAGRFDDRFDGDREREPRPGRSSRGWAGR